MYCARPSKMHLGLSFGKVSPRQLTVQNTVPFLPCVFVTLPNALIVVVGRAALKVMKNQYIH